MSTVFLYERVQIKPMYRSNQLKTSRMMKNVFLENAVYLKFPGGLHPVSSLSRSSGKHPHDDSFESANMGSLGFLDGNR